MADVEDGDWGISSPKKYTPPMTALKSVLFTPDELVRVNRANKPQLWCPQAARAHRGHALDYGYLKEHANKTLKVRNLKCN